MTAPPSELLMFQVGARVFATAVGDVIRIGNVAGVPDEELVEGTTLGQAFSRGRGIVVSGQLDGSEATLVVDQVLGVRQVAEDEIRPLPPFAAAVLQTDAVAGFVLLDEVPTLLVDLPTLIRERRSAAPAPQPC